MPFISPSKPAVFAGLDLSLNSTGVALLRWDGRVFQPPELHLVKKDKGALTPAFKVERLLRTVAQLQTLGVFGVTAAAVEDYAFGISTEHTNCVFQLGEMGGCVRYQLGYHGVPFWAVPIGTNKRFACGNGAAKKDQVARGMANLWHLPVSRFESYDASDALSLASVAAWGHLGSLPGCETFKFQAAIIKDLGEVIRCKLG